MTKKLTLKCMHEMHELMSYHSRVAKKPVTFTRIELYNLMEKVWPYVSKSPLHRNFPSSGVWAKYISLNKDIVATRVFKMEYDNTVGGMVKTARIHYAVHLEGQGGAQ